MLKLYKLLFMSFLVVMLGACGGSSSSSSDDDDDDVATIDADDAVSQRIAFTDGRLRSGAPPIATNNPGDVSLTNPETAPITLDGGSAGSLGVTLNNVPAGQPFDVNVRFGNSNSFVNVPITNQGIIDQIATNGGGGTLNLPFSLPANICDNVADIQHQIDCYESVDVGGGLNVSTETARQMLLACGTGGGSDFATGPSDYCVDDYPQDACTLLQDNTVGITTQFVTGSSCAASYPNSTYLASASGFCGGSTASFVCGTCALENVSAKPAAKMTLEDAMYNALSQYSESPEARRQITYTPPE